MDGIDLKSLNKEQADSVKTAKVWWERLYSDSWLDYEPWKNGIPE
jgi:hypothetical protein